MTAYRDRGATGYYMELRGKPTIIVRAGAVPVPKDTPGKRAKVRAWEALCRIREKRHKRQTDRAWLIAARAGVISTI